MLITWKDQYDIPIFNYYESFKDLKFMLKEPVELDYAKYQYLSDKLLKLQDWFSKEINENAHKSSYSKLTKLFKLRYQYNALQGVLNGVKGFDGCMFWYLKGQKLEDFKKLLQSLNVAYRIEVTDQVKDIERKLKGIKNSLGILEKELAKNATKEDYNYMETVIMANKELGFRINPREYTLYEWVNTLKTLKKKDNGGRN